ncbi:MAG: hypothetical protein RR061_09335 [Muribaculaceae bacterium]
MKKKLSPTKIVSLLCLIIFISSNIYCLSLIAYLEKRNDSSTCYVEYNLKGITADEFVAKIEQLAKSDSSYSQYRNAYNEKMTKIEVASENYNYRNEKELQIYLKSINKVLFFSVINEPIPKVRFYGFERAAYIDWTQYDYQYENTDINNCINGRDLSPCEDLYYQHIFEKDVLDKIGCHYTPRYIKNMYYWYCSFFFYNQHYFIAFSIVIIFVTFIFSWLKRIGIIKKRKNQPH